MKHSYATVKKVDIGFLVVLILLLGLLTPYFINRNRLKTSQDLTNVDDYLALIESVADNCYDDPFEELPEIQRQWCNFPDETALVWVFNDKFSDEQKHTVCSSRGPWAIIQTTDDFDFCLTNALPSADSSDLRSIGRRLFEANNEPQLQLVIYQEDSRIPRNNVTFEPASGMDILIFPIFVTAIYSMLLWLPTRLIVKTICAYRALLAAIKDRLLRGLPTDDLPRISGKIFVSAEALWRNSLMHDISADGSAADVPVVLYLTPSRLLFVTREGHNEIVIRNITAMDVDVGNSYAYPSLVISQSSGQHDYFALTSIKDTVDGYCWMILPSMIMDNTDLNHISDSNINHLLKEYQDFIIYHPYVCLSLICRFCHFNILERLVLKYAAFIRGLRIFRPIPTQFLMKRS